MGLSQCWGAPTCDFWGGTSEEWEVKGLSSAQLWYPLLPFRVCFLFALLEILFCLFVLK